MFILTNLGFCKKTQKVQKELKINNQRGRTKERKLRVLGKSSANWCISLEKAPEHKQSNIEYTIQCSQEGTDLYISDVKQSLVNNC